MSDQEETLLEPIEETEEIEENSEIEEDELPDIDELENEDFDPKNTRPTHPTQHT